MDWEEEIIQYINLMKNLHPKYIKDASNSIVEDKLPN